MRQGQAVEVVSAEKTAVWGRWRVTVRTRDGREVTGWGLTETQALYRAGLRAHEGPGQ